MSKIIPENDDLCYGCRLEQEKKNFIQPPETPYEKKIVFFKVIEASLQAKGF